MAPRKVDFALQIQSQGTTLADLAAALGELYNTYFDSGYNGGGADPITDEDLEGHNLTAADIANMITLTENLDKFLNAQVPVVGDYSATLNQIRTIP